MRVGGNFAHVMFYTGQGFMVREDSGFDSVDDLGGRDGLRDYQHYYRVESGGLFPAKRYGVGNG